MANVRGGLWARHFRIASKELPDLRGVGDAALVANAGAYIPVNPSFNNNRRPPGRKLPSGRRICVNGFTC